MGTLLSYKRPDGKTANGYFAPAGAAHAPGIVVIQEWWGLQEQIRGVVDRFALAGYNAIAPDLYEGIVVPYHDRDTAGHQMNSLDFLDTTDQTVRGAAQFLASSGVKVAIAGFCMGGAVTVISACRLSEFACAIPFYGIPPESVATAADVKIPMQCHFAINDHWCTPEATDKFEADLKAAGKDFEFYRYEAEHGFVNEQRNPHSHGQAEIAWGRMLQYLGKHLA